MKLLLKKFIECHEDDGQYGYEFKEIGIITMILSKDLYHVPERKYISRKIKKLILD